MAVIDAATTLILKQETTDQEAFDTARLIRDARTKELRAAIHNLVSGLMVGSFDSRNKTGRHIAYLATLVRDEFERILNWMRLDHFLMAYEYVFPAMATVVGLPAAFLDELAPRMEELCRAHAEANSEAAALLRRLADTAASPPSAAPRESATAVKSSSSLPTVPSNGEESTQDDFVALVSKARRAVKTLPAEVLEALYYRFRREEYVPPDSGAWQAAKTAIEYGLFVELNFGNAIELNPRNARIRSAIEALDELAKWVREPPEGFFDWYAANYDNELPEIELRSFWNRHIL